jgi:hypothetical protein
MPNDKLSLNLQKDMTKLRVLGPSGTFASTAFNFHGSMIAGQFHGRLDLTAEGAGTFRLEKSQHFSSVHVSRDKDGNLVLTLAE